MNETKHDFSKEPEDAVKHDFSKEPDDAVEYDSSKPPEDEDFDELKEFSTSRETQTKADVSEKDEDLNDSVNSNPPKRESAKEKPVFDVRNSGTPKTPASSEDTQGGVLRAVLLILLIFGLAWWFMGNAKKSAPITYGFFLEQLEANNIEKVVVNENRVSGEFRVPPMASKSAVDSQSETGKSSDKPASVSESTPANEAASVGETAQAGEGVSAGETARAGEGASAGEAAQAGEGTSAGEAAQAGEGTLAVEAAQAGEGTSAGEAAQAGKGTLAMEAAPAGESTPTNGVIPEVKSAPEGAGTPASKDASNETGSKDKKQVLLPKKFTTVLPSLVEAGGELDSKIRERVGKEYKVEQTLDAVGYIMLFSLALTIVLIVSIWMQFRKTRDQLGGGPMFGFSKSPAKRFQGGDGSATFDDVAGLKSVKEDISEIVDFLKNPKKFERLGARVPKGVLMSGPPGTGKTLLARAIAGEANVPFFSINASEFIQLFVGVGASRVRDMFDVARSNAPSILFIDEIDAIGRERGTGTGGGNDEREQTLNQILSEMDGFATTDLVIVIAATNRPDVLDPALLRPGRFDRRVTVGRPVHKDRIQLFKVHSRKVPLASDVDFERLAPMTTGLTGADIRNIVNEAALWACRSNRENVCMADFYYAIDKVLMGAKREEFISEDEKLRTAYHEAGHTLVSWLTPESNRVSKVSVIPRGYALGVTWSVPEEDRLMHSQRDILARLKMMLGGREAEKLVFNELNAGAANDLERATELAQKMVSVWGMSPRIGPAAFSMSDEHPFLGRARALPRNFSEKTAEIIDEEIMRILNDISQQVETLLADHRNMLDALAQALVIHEEMDEKQIEEILGPPAYRKRIAEDD